MKIIVLALFFINLILASPTLASGCAYIQNLDKKNFCMAQKERNNRYCSYIQNMDNSSYCYAIVDNDSRRCHYIKNNDSKQFCLSNF